MITINIDKAKEIGHQIRREQRAEEFKPLDEVIAKQIPGTTQEEAEAARQAIREKYSEIQAQIDSASTPEDIKGALNLGGV
jgi:hypothetical protein